MLSFCRENGFDPVRPAEWAFKEPFHETRTPLAAPGHDYPYDVRPATDARPYFFKFFRWSRVGDLFAEGATTFAGVRARSVPPATSGRWAWCSTSA